MVGKHKLLALHNTFIVLLLGYLVQDVQSISVDVGTEGGYSPGGLGGNWGRRRKGHGQGARRAVQDQRQQSWISSSSPSRPPSTGGSPPSSSTNWTFTASIPSSTSAYYNPSSHASPPTSSASPNSQTTILAIAAAVEPSSWASVDTNWSASLNPTSLSSTAAYISSPSFVTSLPTSLTPTTTGTTSRAASPSATASNCAQPPSDFSGTASGFASICKVYYCPAARANNMQWAGNTGAVTRQEIETALGMLASTDPVLSNLVGNALADGYLGQAAFNSGLLFETTGDRRALDFAVRFADNILALRNNPKTGTVLWTGERELVWPTYRPNGWNQTTGDYAGSENGEIVGHMVNAAVYILKTPCLWGLTPAPYDGPTAFSPSDTYLTRALAFVKAGDETVDTYFLKYFLDSNRLLIQPADGRWLQVKDASNLPGAKMPWNRRMMVLHALMRLAAAHETLPMYDPSRTWLYDDIVRKNIKDFTSSLRSVEKSNGAETFVWNYVSGKNSTEESQGIHGYYDILGTWMAWQRNPWLNGVTDRIGEAFANTMQFTINLGNNTFSGLVDGTTTNRSSCVPGLWGGWSFYSMWLPEWFDTLATANVQSGFNGRTWLAIPLLWTKNARFLNDASFWRGKYASGLGFIQGTSEPSLRAQQVLIEKIKMAKRSGGDLSITHHTSSARASPKSGMGQIVAVSVILTYTVLL